MMQELESLRKELEAIQAAEGRRPAMVRTVGAFEAATRALRIVDKLIANQEVIDSSATGKWGAW